MSKNTLLFEAVRYNRHQALALLLHYGAVDVRTSESLGTALHFAAQLGHIRCVGSLVLGSSSIVAPDSRGRSAIVHAARWGHLAVVRYLYRRMDIHEKWQNLQINLAISMAAYRVCCLLSLF